MNLVQLDAIRESDPIRGREVYHLYVNPEHVVTVSPNEYSEGEGWLRLHGKTGGFAIVGTAHETALKLGNIGPAS